MPYLSERYVIQCIYLYTVYVVGFQLSMLSYAKAHRVLGCTYWTGPYKMLQIDILAYYLTITCFSIDFSLPSKRARVPRDEESAHTLCSITS